MKITKCKVTIDLNVFKEETQYIAHSKMINISGYGNTEKEAIEMFHYATKEFFRDITNKEK